LVSILASISADLLVARLPTGAVRVVTTHILT
jgi:hypothetical protein